MNVTDIHDAQERRNRICQIADWVVAEVPWTVAVADWPEFWDRWPDLTHTELSDVESELQSRGDALGAADADLDAIAGSLAGRPERWMAAADWLENHPGRDIADPEFYRLFSELSRAELILAAIEHRKRLVSRSGS